MTQLDFILMSRELNSFTDKYIFWTSNNDFSIKKFDKEALKTGTFNAYKQILCFAQQSRVETKINCIKCTIWLEK